MTQLQPEGPTGAETAAGALGARSIATGLPAPTKSLLLNLAPSPPLLSQATCVGREVPGQPRERGAAERWPRQRTASPAPGREPLEEGGWREDQGLLLSPPCQPHAACPRAPAAGAALGRVPLRTEPPGSLQGLPQALGCPHQKPRAQPRRHPGLCSWGWGGRPALRCCRPGPDSTPGPRTRAWCWQPLESAGQAGAKGQLCGPSDRPCTLHPCQPPWVLFLHRSHNPCLGRHRRQGALRGLRGCGPLPHMPTHTHMPTRPHTHTHTRIRPPMPSQECAPATLPPRQTFFVRFC